MIEENNWSEDTRKVELDVQDGIDLQVQLQLLPAILFCKSNETLSYIYVLDQGITNSTVSAFVVPREFSGSVSEFSGHYFTNGRAYVNKGTAGFFCRCFQLKSHESLLVLSSIKRENHAIYVGASSEILQDKDASNLCFQLKKTI